MQRLAREVVGQRRGAGSGISQVEEHENLLIARKSQKSVKTVGIEIIDPAAVHILGSGGKHQMSGYDGSVLDAGVASASGICIDIIPVEGHDKNRGCAVATGSDLVDFGKCLLGSGHIDVLFLKIFAVGARRPPSRILESVMSSTFRSEYFLQE